MTKKTQRWHNLAKLPLVAAIAATVSAPVGAFQFNLGEIEGSLDTTLTAGASWRVEARDKNQLAQGNLGVPQFGRVGSSTNNSDDGNWNFKRGETFSKVVKGTTDLSLTYQDYGLFTRARYYYDFELKDEGRARDNRGNYRKLNDDALEQAGADAEILDAFIYGNFYIADMPLNLRLGKQVISWGESTFIAGGINSFSPVDASAARSPGAEVKDILLPVNMIYGSLGATSELSVEAFYQLEWEKTRVDPCGTFFSTSDIGADGCGPVLVAGQLSDYDAYQQGFRVNRVGDREPDDGGQYGVALRWFADSLGGSEFAFYYMNYHSRLPLASGITSAAGETFGKYFIEYPEDIQLFGLSFNTMTESGYSIGGEISHRRDVPVQWNGFEMVYAGIQFPYSRLYMERKPDGVAVGDWNGQEYRAWDPYDITQVQFTVVKFFDQVLGAGRMTVVGEVGATYIHGFPGTDKPSVRSIRHPLAMRLPVMAALVQPLTTIPSSVRTTVLPPISPGATAPGSRWITAT